MNSPFQIRKHDFYPRPPRGGRPLQRRRPPKQCTISIHALREEGDLTQRKGHSTKTISIHALREEGDFPSSPLYMMM